MRNGSPEKNSPSPFNGRSKYVYDSTKEFTGSVIPLLESDIIPDYNADKQMPSEGRYFKRDKGVVPTYYLRRLEEIDESWIMKYFENQIYGIRFNKKNSIKEFNKKHREIRTWSDEEGELTSEADLLTEKPFIKIKDIEYAKDKIPYILKRLHEKSKSCGISILSVIIAYEKVLLNNIGSNIEKPKPGQMLNEGVYKMDRSGYVGFRVHDNKGQFQEHVSKWIRGEDEHKDSYFEDAVELLELCDKANIDLLSENPKDYQEDFINSLVVTYITKNRDFISRYDKSYNIETKKDLRNISLDSYNKKVIKHETLTYADRVMEKTQRFLDTTMLIEVEGNARHDLRRHNNHDRNLVFIAMHNYGNGGNIDLNSKRTRDGFYVEKGNMPMLLDVTYLCHDPAPMGQTLFACMHSSGYLVLISNSRELYYLNIETAIEYQKDYNIGAVRNHIRYQGNQKYGKWTGTLR